MRNLRHLLLASFGLAIVPTTALPQGDRPVDAYWYCFSAPDGDPIYVTVVWEARISPQEVNQEYKKYLAAKYDYQGRTTCSGANKSSPTATLAKAKQDAENYFAALGQSGRKIVRVTWTSNDPEVGPPPVQWSVCAVMITATGGTPNSGPFETYVSDAFDAGEAGVQAQQDAFAAYLRTRYSITTTDLHPQCTLRGDEASARAAIKYWNDSGSRRGKVIETGWKLTP